jgi:tetratricopeptide (TPR) repeat protein
MSNARRFACLFAATSIAAVFTFTTACGGTSTPKNDVDPNPDVDDGASQSQDQVFDKYEEGIAITGQVYMPKALGVPGMIRISPKRNKLKLDKQRKAVAKGLKSGKVKEQDVQFLATLLWDSAKKNPEKDAELKTEMRDTLAQFHATGKLAKPETLQMLATIELVLGNEGASLKIGEELLANHADYKGAEAARTWVGYLKLRGGDTVGATATFDGFEPTKPEGQYVKAWVDFRNGNYAPAVASVANAAKTWPGALQATAAAVVDDMHLMIGWGLSVADAKTTYEGVVDQAAEAQQIHAVYVWLARLADVYASVGRFDRAVEALDVSLTVKADAPLGDVLKARFQQANYELRQNHPAEAAARFLEAWDVVQTKCDETCSDQNKEAVPANIAKVAQLIHTVYATTLDESYYEPANQLYLAYLSITPERADHAQILTFSKRLEETKANAQPSAGKHDADRMKDVITLRQLAVKGCYERALQVDSALQGTITVTIDVSDKGEVLGGSTDPAGGAEGLASVATCTWEAVKTWSFPGRSVPGKSVVVFPFTVSPGAAQ